MADYTYTAGQTIRFGRKDTELTHLWDFGDGNTSILPNPFHTYSSLGPYTVTHTAWNPCGTCIGGVTHTVEVVSNLSIPSTADYKFQLGEEIHFNRRDTELTHLWDFGDGNTSILPDLFYIYTVPGTYTVTHTAYNICGTCIGGMSHTVEILPSPTLITATDMTGIPSLCILPCNTTVRITWTNFGGAGTFVPSIIVDGARTALPPEILGSGESVSHSFSQTLLLGYHTICPDPN